MVIRMGYSLIGCSFLGISLAFAQGNHHHASDLSFAMERAGVNVGVLHENNEDIAKIKNNMERLVDVFSDDYAGTWLEYDAEGRVYQVIALSKERSFDKNMFDYEFKIVFVKNRLSDLVRLKEAIKEKYLNDGGLIFSIYVDEKINRVVVRGKLENFEKIEKSLKSEGYPMDLIEIHEQESSIFFHGDLYGGTPILASNIGGSRAGKCTAGFNGFVGFYQVNLTAGHCALRYPHVFFDYGNAFGPPVKGDRIGGFLENKISKGVDVALFANMNWAHNFLPVVLPRYSVKPPVQSLRYEHICTYGGVSGLRCGFVRSLAVDHLAQGYAVKYDEADFCGRPGDSGGPVFTFLGNATGIYAGAVGNHPNGNCASVGGGSSSLLSVYTPILAALDAFPGLVINTR